MLRAVVVVATLGVVALCAGAARAEEVFAKVKSLDKKMRILVVTVDGEEKKYAVGKDCEVFRQKGTNTATRERLPDGLDNVKDGAFVQLHVYKTKGELELVSGIRLDPPKPPKKKK